MQGKTCVVYKYDQMCFKKHADASLYIFIHPSSKSAKSSSS